MQEKLKIFKSLNNMEKVFAIKDLVPEFIHSYERARNSMEALNKQFVDRRLVHSDGELNGKSGNGTLKTTDDSKTSSSIPTLPLFHNIIGQPHSGGLPMTGMIGGQEYGGRGMDSMFADGSQNILGDPKGMGNFGAM